MNNKAFSILETLISLTVIIFISLAALKVLHTMALNKQFLQKQSEFHYQNFRLEGIINEITRRYDQHSFLELKPKLLNAQEINYLYLTGKNQQAKPNSQGIYFPTLSWLDLAYVSGYQDNQLIACHITTANITKSNQVFLGISTKGFSYWIGESNHSSKNCRSYSLQTSDNSLKLLPDSLYQLKLLLPIQNEKLIYLDESNQLRLITLEGLEVKENSTLLTNISRLSLEFDYIPTLTVHYQIKFHKYHKIFSGESFSSIKHYTYQNFFLNMLI